MFDCQLMFKNNKQPDLETYGILAGLMSLKLNLKSRIIWAFDVNYDLPLSILL